MNSSKDTKTLFNHPHTYDHIKPDWELPDKLRAYRSILEEIRNQAAWHGNPGEVSMARKHIKDARFMLGYTLSAIGISNPYMKGQTGRALGKKEVVETVDVGFKFKEENLPDANNAVEICDFIRANLEKVGRELKDLIVVMAYFNGHQFIFFERAIQEIYLAKAYMGEALYKEGKEAGYKVLQPNIKIHKDLPQAHPLEFKITKDID